MTRIELLKKAEQCKRLAGALSDESARRILEQMGREYEHEADRERIPQLNSRH